MKLQLKVIVFIVTVATTVCLVNAQYPPQRLAIPGAAHAPIARPVVRVRRPIAAKPQNYAQNNISPRVIEESKPVIESAEDEVPDAYLPQLLREQQLAQAQQAQFQQTAAAFLNNEQNAVHETPISHLLTNDDTLVNNNPFSTRFPERQSPSTTPSSKPVFNDFGIGANIINSPRFSQDRSQAPQLPPPQPPPQRERAHVIRNRPTELRETRPQIVSQPVAVQSRPRPKPIQSRPAIEQNQIVLQERESQQNSRRQRPIAQTIRKWREENEDGSITWGYENDDGSFKEELIGTDCITKGTYGYVDPDGNKREYHYETGIKCDPNKRNEDVDLQDNGFINYEENRAVLPNGIEIDMSQLGKKKSKRPGVNYRN